MAFGPSLLDATDTLPARADVITVARPHLTLGVSMNAPYPDDTETAYVGMGCFWGAERKFYETPGVYVTSVGYQGGVTANPSYQDVCTGRTNHTEVVKVVFRPSELSFEGVLKVFFENHDPTQGFRQGGDIGTQYRSAIYFTSDAQRETAERMMAEFQLRLNEAGYGTITTEVAPAGPFYSAEEYHQQYLTANPNGYCGLGGTGVSCPIGVL